ncbi:hypothetical protein CALCODRAFT_167204 [Calocera cornea HHB12733]|uniref:Uncharacterized protein n=1 Tax=Calocera cornea HHB12733 TaxID=1353952 RepID=A0A165HY08_9BASI|nr:hypothetical protein CALCODRAFT_167204 [Calocera cornea HHB12733]
MPCMLQAAAASSFAPPCWATPSSPSLRTPFSCIASYRPPFCSPPPPFIISPSPSIPSISISLVPPSHLPSPPTTSSPTPQQQLPRARPPQHKHDDDGDLLPACARRVLAPLHTGPLQRQPRQQAPPPVLLLPRRRLPLRVRRRHGREHGLLRRIPPVPNTQAGRAVSPTPTVRPAHAGPSRPSHARLAGIPAPAPPPNHALPSVPPQAGGYPMQPQQRGAPIPGHARSPTAASYASSYASPADQRMAALARLEGRPAPPPNQRPPPPPQQNGYPQNGYSQNGYAPPPSGASFLSLSDAPQGRSYPSQPRRS